MRRECRDHSQARSGKIREFSTGSKKRSEAQNIERVVFLSPATTEDEHWERCYSEVIRRREVSVFRITFTHSC